MQRYHAHGTSTQESAGGTVGELMGEQRPASTSAGVGKRFRACGWHRLRRVAVEGALLRAMMAMMA